VKVYRVNSLEEGMRKAERRRAYDRRMSDGRIRQLIILGVLVFWVLVGACAVSLVR
jgi:hypothetical protein